MLRAGVIAVDIVLAKVQAAHSAEQVGFGDMVGYTPSALDTQATAVFELHTREDKRGFGGVHALARDRAEIVVQGAESAAERAPTARAGADAAALEIGRLVASLVPDEATLQLGLGAVPEALVPGLAGKKSLGLHSGIFMPSLRELIANGTITGHAKSRDAGLHVATGIMANGGAHAASWGPATQLQPVRQTHDPAALLSQQRLWAINSALEVDMAGQVNSEFVDGVRIASGGGLADFACAAHFSEGGASVIAVPSQTRDGRSRLVARLGARTQPTLQGQAVDFVVTEQGIARLRGLSVGERAQALIDVAHPAHRATLRRQLQEES
ncbi:MAG TPA: acetyl-CoA hydrolase/transferase C-terminal domain-containing protein [Variovorax sp.]|nr:acetyl-CoA hydrolase/transferase C-terminal domain-containing protein [Variovorax sp.]